MRALCLLFFSIAFACAAESHPVPIPSADAGPADGSTSDAETMCAGDYGRCDDRDDCCNGRHSCLFGICRYSCAEENGFCYVGEDCCNTRHSCIENVCQY